MKTEKLIVDIVGDLPVILLELNPSNGSVLKTYIYGNSQIIAQHDGDYSASRYFYLHDRLGSVRQIIDTSGNIKNRYTFNPFGKGFLVEREQTIDNSFKFTGQYHDLEIRQYYLRARQYHPHIGRFTSRDPVAGKFEEPLSLHKYLYCLNDPINNTDPTGEFLGFLWTQGWVSDMRAKTAAAGASAYAFTERAVSQVQLYHYRVAIMAYEGTWTQSLRTNLIRLTGDPGSRYQAHHIIPREFIGTINPILQRVGMDINHPIFGMWIERGAHTAIHSAGYNRAWESFLAVTHNPTTEQIVNFARQLAEQYGYQTFIP